ncbi:hypothetical protein [Shimia isoporae]|nr:hypothetical protein [Shimia isoporae]
MDWVLANDTGEAFCNLMSVGPLDPNPANRLWALTIAKNPEGTWWGFPPHWLLYHAPEDPPFQFEVQRFPPGTTINASSFVYPDHFSSDGAERFAVEIILFRCSDSDALNLPTPLRRSDWMGDPPQPKALYSDGLIYLRSTLSDLLPPPADK